ncbi:MAG TPA: NAD(+)/NADH kinase [Capsulimonadaceae bacterium]|jgi:NAD+ kinase
MIEVRRVGVVANSDKPAALDYAKEAVRYLLGKVDELVLQHPVAHAVGRGDLAADDHDVASTDVVLVFGGDGTILRASRLCAPLGTPMLGVNLGRFGFLNEIPPENLCPSLDRLIEGDFDISSRLTLECRVQRGEQTIGSDIALNEVVVAHGRLARVLQLSIAINNKFLTSYAADGIIVATPTGSTAYSLSAGGPLVHPSIRTMLLTPICPHTLTTRALLVPEDHEIAISVDRADGDVIQVTIDGQRGLPMDPHDLVIVRRSPTPARLITHIGGDSFYEKLQSKLHWGESVVY